MDILTHLLGTFCYLFKVIGNCAFTPWITESDIFLLPADISIAFLIPFPYNYGKVKRLLYACIIKLIINQYHSDDSALKGRKPSSPLKHEYVIQSCRCIFSKIKKLKPFNV